MSIVQIGDFGKNSKGIHTISINATEKEDLYSCMAELRSNGWKLWDTPNILKSFKTYHVKIQIYKGGFI
jgi:hypothetical protein